jgi:hypothetical protein
MYSLGLDNPSCIHLTTVKLGFENKLAGTAFHSVLANWAQICTADRGVPRYLDPALPRRK